MSENAPGVPWGGDLYGSKMDFSFLNSSKEPDDEAPSEPGGALLASSVDRNAELEENGFIKLNTHDVSFVEEHIPSIEKFADDLQISINAAWPTRKKSNYENVHVLLLSWEDDNLGVEQEIKRLRHIFANLYRFDVQEYQIPRKKPGKAAISRVSSFLELDDHGTLLIVYYAGHARLSRQTNEPPIWAATDKPGSPTMPSGGIQQLVEEAESDVLLLYDSCHSAHPAVNISGQGVTELIAACGFETQAPAVGLHSFTNALIRELEESFAGPPISVAELHSRVISSLKNWKPSLLRDEDGNVWTDENGRAKYECHKRRTPIHCFLTNESPYRSIMLAPLPSKLSHASGTSKNRAIGSNGWVVGYETTLEACEPPFLTEKPYPTAEGQSSTSNEGLHSTLASQVSSSTQPTTVSGSWRTAEALRVLLAVRLEDDFFLDDEGEDDDGKKVRIWCNWLKAIPDGAQNISIEGVYKSCSALVIMSLPIALWDLLPDNAAYSFIGFVKPNILSKEELPSFEPVIDDSMPNKLLSAAPDLFEWNVQLPESLKSKATEGSNTLRADSNREHEIAQESQDYEDIGSTSTNFSVSERHFTLLRQLEEAKDRAAFLSHTSSLLAQLSFAKQEHRDMVDGDRNWRMVQELLKSERLRIDFLKFQLVQEEMDLRGLI